MTITDSPHPRQRWRCSVAIVFLPNVKDEPRPWLARLVLLGARDVTAMVVGSGALLGFWSIRIKSRIDDPLMFPLALQTILQVFDGFRQLVVVKLAFIVEILTNALFRNREHLLGRDGLPQTRRKFVIGETADRLRPRIPHPLNQTAFEFWVDPRTNNLRKTKMF
jgi:hypothetical protein